MNEEAYDGVHKRPSSWSMVHPSLSLKCPASPLAFCFFSLRYVILHIPETQTAVTFDAFSSCEWDYLHADCEAESAYTFPF